MTDISDLPFWEIRRGEGPITKAKDERRKREAELTGREYADTENQMSLVGGFGYTCANPPLPSLDDRDNAPCGGLSR